MAITITNSPQIFTPSENMITWQVSTDATTLVYFKFDVLVSGSDLLLDTFNLYPTPLNPTSSYIDLSRLLRNEVKWQADNTMVSLVAPVVDPLFAYRVVITEILYDSSTQVFSNGAVYSNSADKFFAFQSQLDRIAFHAYVQNNFVINSSTSSRFLTNKPDYVNVNTNSSEVLYFLQTGQTALNVVVNTYGASGLINTYTSAITGLTTNNMYRLHASQKALGSILGISFTNVTYYTIQIFDGSSVARTELRTFNVFEFEPFYSFANVWFANNLGGWDVYMFLNPQKTIATKKTNIKQNIYALDGSGVYTDIDNGIFNPSIENINTVTTTSFKAVSRPLTDLEANWLQELYQSRQAYLELADGTLAPITITSNSYPIKLNKYNRSEPNWVDIQFTLTDNISPTI